MLHAALEMMEPEDFVGNLWHDWASRLAAPAQGTAEAAVTLEEMRTSVAVLFRALGGGGGVEIGPAPQTVAPQRRRLREQVAGLHPKEHRATFDGERLRLPPELAVFPTREMNRAAYLWCAALAAVTEPQDRPEDPLVADMVQLRAMQEAGWKLRELCPGLVPAADSLAAHLRQGRTASPGSATESAVEELALWVLGGPPPFHDRAQELLRKFDAAALAAPRGYAPLAAVPIWPRVERAAKGRSAALDAQEPGQGPQGLAIAGRKRGERKDQDQTTRRDTFILHRFEGILSWAESLNLARMTDDDTDDNAAKAAEDQDHITLSQHWKRAASRLRVSLDLAPQDAEHERLSDRFTYPEWNHRSRSYMPDHARVLESEAEVSATAATPDPRLAARVRRQFEALHPRRVTLPRQMDGAELDLDAVVASRAMIRATGQGSDRIHLASRATERDLAVALLVDCSRSTEAVTGERSVIDTARDSVAALAAGLDKVGDRLAVWGFCSLRRDRVFLHRCKGFGEPMSQAVAQRIGSLRPGHYTRLGAAIRHASAQLAKEGAQKRLLLVLTDGKPNDLDHYEGVHGIEDSRMAVREARALGQSVHGIVIDADGQDWFARIFGRGGFTLLPDPQRLPKALPDIYHGLTRES
ncbi:Nitric oxide reductase activation protein NorD [Rubellimicrobium mesophilum DSM 19309]|uniref:Nitric oxide reductase activation protein NorD n=1 Tax=Rubellimicrobium mesophilum DSM 19309 TaxID=442562 RepID=A0A017HSJ1_9RHOB|nr:VWA domain-containing protein [Rubellimicrobium mesophilum]EYD76724.1 Nitric oxide reductase activation protein NorD [Rubellimicrobium mesophilum DSM 19309]